MKSMARLSRITTQIAALRGMPVAQAAQALDTMIYDLRWLAGADIVEHQTATNLLNRALRAIRPRAHLITDRRQAFGAVVDALTQGPRRPGRPPTTEVTYKTSVSMPEATWQQIDAVAVDEGYTDPEGRPVRAAALRLLIQEALTAREQRKS